VPRVAWLRLTRSSLSSLALVPALSIDRIASANCLRAIAPVTSGHCVVRHDLNQKNERRLGSGACRNIGGAGLTFQDMHRR
jgi:hypothetical protein